jgi:methionine-rich copper-binding protein CopC
MRLWPALVCALLFAILTGSPVQAHAALEDSDPKDESTVPAPPSSVWAEFTEPPMEGSHLEIFDPCGARVDGGDSEVMGYRITVSMAAETSGEYRVEWAVVSATDSHPTTGQFTFTSTSGRSCASDEEPEPQNNDDRKTQRTQSSSQEQNDSLDSTNDTRAQQSGDRVLGKRVRKDAGPARTRQRQDVRQDTNAAPEFDQAAGERSGEQGIPLGALLLGFGLAALIGAGGGAIYRLGLGDDR